MRQETLLEGIVLVCSLHAKTYTIDFIIDFYPIYNTHYKLKKIHIKVFTYYE